MTTIVDMNGQKLSSEKKPTPVQNKYTNKDLYDMFQDYIHFTKGLAGILLRSKLREFYNNNFLRYKTLIEDMEKLQEEWFEFEEDANSPRGKKPRIIETEVDGKKKKEQAMLEGRLYSDYVVALTELMNTPTIIVG